MRCTIFELLFIADIATSFIFHFYTFSHEGQCFDIFPFCYSFFRYFSLSTFFPFDVFPFDIFPFRHFSLSTFFPFDIFPFRHFSLSTFFFRHFYPIFSLFRHFSFRHFYYTPCKSIEGMIVFILTDEFLNIDNAFVSLKVNA